MPFHTVPGILPDSAPNALVSNSAPAAGAAAECWVAINPKDPNKVVCAVREVPSNTKFAQSAITMYYSGDAGSTWKAAPPLGLAPPAPDAPFGANANASVAWDNAGNAYLLTLAVTQDLNSLVGIAFYASTDGNGAKWTGPTLIHKSGANTLDDKPTILVDTGGQFPGRLYAVWMLVGASASNTIVFARSDDKGATWFGTGQGTGNPPGSVLGGTSPWPSAAISPDGDVYIAFRVGTPQGPGFRVLRSVDGGDKFVPGTDVGGLNVVDLSGTTVQVGTAPESGDHFSDGNFRANSFISVCAGNGGLVLCAWLDFTIKTRIYYMRSLDGGFSWKGLAPGTPLSTSPDKNTYHFSPQFSLTPNGVIVCNYYSYRPNATNTGIIDVWAQVSYNQGQTFTDAIRVTDMSWDTSIPMITLGKADDNTIVTFIGDYFGLAAGAIGGIWGEGFISTWTDGRTGSEEIFSARSFLGPLIIYDPVYIWPPLYFDPGDPGPPWARWIIAAILPVLTLAIVGIELTLLGAPTVAGLLPVSIGLSFGSALLYGLSFYALERLSAQREAFTRDNSQAPPAVPDLGTLSLSRKLTAAGIILTMAGLLLTLLPVDSITHERAVPMALYSTILCSALAVAFYLVLRLARRSAK